MVCWVLTDKLKKCHCTRYELIIGSLCFMSWTTYIELLSCVVYFSLHDRKQNPKLLTKLAVGRQRVNNPMDHVSLSVALSFPVQHNFCPHPDFNLHPTLISKTESLMWEERRLERLKKRGSNGQIIEEYDFKSRAILFWSWETYSSLEIKRCGLFCFQTSVNEGAEVSHSGLLCVIRGPKAEILLSFYLPFCLSPHCPSWSLPFICCLSQSGLSVVWWKTFKSEQSVRRWYLSLWWSEWVTLC